MEKRDLVPVQTAEDTFGNVQPAFSTGNCDPRNEMIVPLILSDEKAARVSFYSGTIELI